MEYDPNEILLSPEAYIQDILSDGEVLQNLTTNIQEKSGDSELFKGAVFILILILTIN